jgi:hypothetical protein
MKHSSRALRVLLVGIGILTAGAAWLLIPAAPVSGRSGMSMASAEVVHSPGSTGEQSVIRLGLTEVPTPQITPKTFVEDMSLEAKQVVPVYVSAEAERLALRYGLNDGQREAITRAILSKNAKLDAIRRQYDLTVRAIVGDAALAQFARKSADEFTQNQIALLPTEVQLTDQQQRDLWELSYRRELDHLSDADYNGQFKAILGPSYDVYIDSRARELTDGQVKKYSKAFTLSAQQIGALQNLNRKWQEDAVEDGEAYNREVTLILGPEKEKAYEGYEARKRVLAQAESLEMLTAYLGSKMTLTEYEKNELRVAAGEALDAAETPGDFMNRLSAGLQGKFSNEKISEIQKVLHVLDGMDP